MGFIRSFFYRLRESNHARKAARSHLKAAKNEDPEQFLALAANYIDLAQTYFGSSFSESAEARIARTTELFLNLWQNLRYAERLSDFEFMLGQSLIGSTTEYSSTASPDPSVNRLRKLTPLTRFAYLAYVSGNWPSRWVALVMRIKAPALHTLLSEARCELCDISWTSLSEEERNCLEAISVSLDDKPNVRVNKAISKRSKSCPRVTEIRAQWLELRLEVVEVRMRYIPDQTEREQLLKDILNSITDTPMRKPQLVDKVVNTVQFSRHGKSKAS